MSNAEKVLSKMTSQPQSATQIVELTGLRVQDVDDALLELSSKGKVVRITRGPDGKTVGWVRRN